MITQQLQRNHIQETLKGINGSRNFHFRKLFRERIIALIAKIRYRFARDAPDQDWFPVSGRDLLESRVYLRIQMILGDDENDTHLVVDH
jgi:hypothetical protein